MWEICPRQGERLAGMFTPGPNAASLLAKRSGASVVPEFPHRAAAMVYDPDPIRLPAAWRGLAGPVASATDALVRLDERLAPLRAGPRGRRPCPGASVRCSGRPVPRGRVRRPRGPGAARGGDGRASRDPRPRARRRHAGRPPPPRRGADGPGLLRLRLGAPRRARPRGVAPSGDGGEPARPGRRGGARPRPRRHRPAAGSHPPRPRGLRIGRAGAARRSRRGSGLLLAAGPRRDPRPAGGAGRGHRPRRLAGARPEPARGPSWLPRGGGPAAGPGQGQGPPAGPVARPARQPGALVAGAADAGAPGRAPRGGRGRRSGGRDLDRLTLAREAMLRACTGRRRTSRLPQLVDLFVGTPLVTVASAARALSVSPQAVEGMLAELGPARPRELTERRRYRAWGDRVRASRLRRRLMMWSPHTWRSKSIR
ncbi:hypothetical protein EU555_12745 [Methylobacterium nonmethylotrophicum]|uniref:HTH DNA binding domain-containing protein n=2 Tax=Methylobacterium nonmethylotrophicum TaxID=1141884 RepID=A0A4Z0NR21_9HYPH|nr:hypothetical protein EU555_12745 [Methylobacterium nonmethylotrophicum]